jgi:hypothetical protein
MDAVIQFLTSNGTLVIVGIVTGIAVKYVPFLAKVPNTIIPFLNALIVFFGAFQGGVPLANAGIFGDIAGQLGLGGKIMASMLISSVSSVLFETYLRHPLAKLGLQKAS